MALPPVSNSIPTIRSSLSRRKSCIAESKSADFSVQAICAHRHPARTVSWSHLRADATAWVLLVGALVMEGLVVLVAGHPIHTLRLAAEAGAVAVLSTRTPLGAGRRQHGTPRKCLIHTLKGEEHRFIRVPKHQIHTRRKVGEHQGGAHLLGHRTPMPLPLLLGIRAVVLDLDGAVQRPLGEVQRRNHSLGTRVRPHQLTTSGLVPAPPTSGGWSESSWVSPPELDTKFID